jgi:hydrogenase-4 component B
VLAVGCVALGLAAPHLVEAIGRVASTTFGSTPAASAGPARVWLTAPGGLAQVSPLVVGVLLLAVAVVTAAAVRAGRFRLRYTDTWGCGRIRQTPRMEYTAAAFAEPLRRVFSEVYRPTQDLSISVHPDSRYVVQAITYTSSVSPWIEKALYLPVLQTTRAGAARIRRVQGGSIHLYLLYVAGALMAALVFAWWFR